MITPRIISIISSPTIASSSAFCATTRMRILSTPSMLMTSSRSSTPGGGCFMTTAAAAVQSLASSTITSSSSTAGCNMMMQFFDKFCQQQSAFSACIAIISFYLTVTNILYLARRSYIRKMPIQKLWKIRTTREPGVTLQLYFVILLAWQAFVLVFPIIEPMARFLGHVSFFYSYPNASGVGIIFEPKNVQHLNQSQRAKHQIRLDWHRFSVNVGSVGRDGFRHPPSIERNLPHIDIPKRGVKHWPWRRRWSNDKKK